MIRTRRDKPSASWAGTVIPMKDFAPEAPRHRPSTLEAYASPGAPQLPGRSPGIRSMRRTTALMSTKVHKHRVASRRLHGLSYRPHQAINKQQRITIKDKKATPTSRVGQLASSIPQGIFLFVHMATIHRPTCTCCSCALRKAPSRFKHQTNKLRETHPLSSVRLHSRR